MKKSTNVAQTTRLDLLKGLQLQDVQYAKMLVMFKAISDETRLRIVWLLEQDMLCVSDIALVLDMSVSAVSHQLKYLKKANIVRSEKEGKQVFYTLMDDCIRDIVKLALHHISE